MILFHKNSARTDELFILQSYLTKVLLQSHLVKNLPGKFRLD